MLKNLSDFYYKSWESNKKKWEEHDKYIKTLEYNNTDFCRIDYELVKQNVLNPLSEKISSLSYNISSDITKIDNLKTRFDDEKNYLSSAKKILDGINLDSIAETIKRHSEAEYYKKIDEYNSLSYDIKNINSRVIVNFEEYDTAIKNYNRLEKAINNASKNIFETEENVDELKRERKRYKEKIDASSNAIEELLKNFASLNNECEELINNYLSK